MSEWKKAVERSKIPRVPWKMILGVSLERYIQDNKFQKDEIIIQNVMIKVREKIHILKIQGWTMQEINKNLLISVSARRAEQRLYQ